VDPHALPPVPFHHQQVDAPIEDVDWGEGHWAMNNQDNIQNEGIQQAA
jgi:hypothetical protein